MGALLCDPSRPWVWLSRAAGGVWQTIQLWWPLLAAGAVAALRVGALLALVVRRARGEAAGRAWWVAITPPAVMPPEGARGLWLALALAGLLSRTRRHGFTPRHLAVEFVADAAGMRAGVWVPPGLSAASVAEAIGGCWPGARATITRTPPSWEASRVTAVHVLPRGGAWAPLLDLTRSARRQSGEVDPLHSVLAALAERGEGERACVQLVVSRAATIGRQRRDRPLWARIVFGVLRVPFVVFLAVTDTLLTRGSATNRPATTTTSTPDDPAVAARRKAVEAKQAHGPHLRATLRLASGDPMPDPTQCDPERLRVVLDHGEVVELDGGTLVVDGEESPSVVLRLAPWRTRSLARALAEWSSASRIFHRPTRPQIEELELSRTLELAASALGEGDKPIVHSPRGARVIPNRQRLAAVAILGEREPQLSAVQPLALVDAAAWWLSEPNGGEKLAYALLTARAFPPN